MRYLDTSSLVALYFPEAKTDRLIRHLQGRKSPLAFTWLHEIEFTNGLQLKVFRNEADEAAVNATLNALRSDVESGVFQRPPISWPGVFERATVISLAQSRTHGTRTLDLLHVAAAIALRADEFVTGDERQAKVAAVEGLNVVKL